jgi:hypothetical protein
MTAALGFLVSIGVLHVAVGSANAAPYPGGALFSPAQVSIERVACVTRRVCAPRHV